jgi:hypothetical protein
VDCGVNTFSSNPGSISCTSCSPGLLAASNRSTFCSPCPAGQVQFGGACSNCPAGSYAQLGAANCSLCPPGSYALSGQDRCSVCPAGTYSTSLGASSNASCIMCGPGSYSLSDGSSSCNLCPSGSFSTVSGATFYPCLDCIAGTYSSIPGSSLCTNCSGGFFSAITGSTVCSPCQSGSYTANAGSTQCLPCANGTTNALVGQPGCMVCLPGQYPQTPTSGCVLCSVGTTSLTGDLTCSPCVLPLVALSVGSARCSSCPFGLTATNPAGPCVPCTQQGYFVDGAGQCQPCAAGSYSTALGCQQCQQGLWSNLASSFCSLCPLGMIGTTPPSDLCNPCQAGTVRYDSLQQSCVVCLPGTFASNPTLSCVACDRGTAQPNARQLSCISCSPGSVAPIMGAIDCTQCWYGEYASSPDQPCEACEKGTFSNATSALSCTRCESDNLCPLASAYGVPPSAVPFFSQLPFTRASAGFTKPTYNVQLLVSQNFWTTTAGIVAITVSCAAFVILGVALCCSYFAKRDGSASFAEWKRKVARVDVLFGVSHVNGTKPKVVIERQTVFGAFMSCMVIFGCCILIALLVLNWYYSPSLNSSVIPFGYANEPDPSGNISFHSDFWGWTGDCPSVCSSNSFLFSGLGLKSGSDWQISCVTKQFSCAVNVDAVDVVISSTASITLVMPIPGNAMGVTYTFALSPALNSSSQSISETIWAGSDAILGGGNSILVPISTTWAKVTDRTKNIAISGWLLSASASSTGSTLDNTTYTTATNKRVTMQLQLQRGTTFLAVFIDYGISVAILIGSIVGYLVAVWFGGRVILRLAEHIHQHFHGVPVVVSEYLASLNPPSAMGPEAIPFDEYSFKFENSTMMIDDTPQLSRTVTSSYDPALIINE